MPASAQPRFQRLDPDRRRTQILASAARHFGEKPYAAVSIAEVAADAGAARALVNHYFGNKRDLYLAVVQSMMFIPDSNALLPIEGTREERIAGAIEWLMDIVEEYGQGWLNVATAGGFGSDPEVQQLLDEADDRAADSVLDLVGLSYTSAHRESARAAVRALGGMVKAMGRELVDRKTITSAEARQILTAAFTAVLDLAFVVDDDDDEPTR